MINKVSQEKESTLSLPHFQWEYAVCIVAAASHRQFSLFLLFICLTVCKLLCWDVFCFLLLAFIFTILSYWLSRCLDSCFLLNPMCCGPDPYVWIICFVQIGLSPKSFDRESVLCSHIAVPPHSHFSPPEHDFYRGRTTTWGHGNTRKEDVIVSWQTV